MTEELKIAALKYVHMVREISQMLEEDAEVTSFTDLSNFEIAKTTLKYRALIISKNERFIAASKMFDPLKDYLKTDNLSLETMLISAHYSLLLLDKEKTDEESLSILQFLEKDEDYQAAIAIYEKILMLSFIIIAELAEKLAKESKSNDDVTIDDIVAMSTHKEEEVKVVPKKPFWKKLFNI